MPRTESICKNIVLHLSVNTTLSCGFLCHQQQHLLMVIPGLAEQKLEGGSRCLVPAWFWTVLRPHALEEQWAGMFLAQFTSFTGGETKDFEKDSLLGPQGRFAGWLRWEVTLLLDPLPFHQVGHCSHQGPPGHGRNKGHSGSLEFGVCLLRKTEQATSPF